MHSALVSISGSGDELYIHVQLIHSFLRKVLEVEHIRFCSQNGQIRLQEEKHPFVYQVAQLINATLSEDIQSMRAGLLRVV